MDQDPTAADAAHAMDTALRNSGMQSDGARFARLRYEVDPDAVAAAIVAQLLAGKRLAAEPDPDARWA